MNDRRLLKHLEAVAGRIRLVRLGVSLALVWLLAAVAAAGLLWLNHSSGVSVSLAPPVLGAIALAAAVVCVLLALRSARDYHWVAQQIESRFPDLNSSLLTAIELKPDLADGRYGYLQESVLRQAFYHAYVHRWWRVVPTWRLLVAQAANGVGVLALAAAMLALVFLAAPPTVDPITTTTPFQQVSIVDAVYQATIEPGSTEIERGTSLLVLARFSGPLPPDASLVYKLEGEDEERIVPMSKSLDDPVFGGRIPSVEQPLTYRITYGGASSDSYGVTVFEYPELVRADATLTFPEYTKLEPRTIQDVRRISAVEGTTIALTCVLNKRVAQAQLVEKVGEVIEMSDMSDSTTTPPYLATITLDRSRRFQLMLLDEQGRANRSNTEFVFNMLPNRPPELKLVAPKRDVQVSPIEELDLKATAWDDYGLARAGLSYSIPGITDGEVVLAEATAAKDKTELAHLLAFEELKAEPDQLLAYYFWAEDIGPDGQVRRASGDMYFAEVRHFEEIFRQGQQPTEGEAQQQQQQQQQGSQNAQQAEQLAELQKQIINGTWKVMRRETSAEPSERFAEDVQLLVESQLSALEQAEGLAEQIEDQQSLVHVEVVKQQMQTAVLELSEAKDGPEIPALKPALAAEQAAYQALLRLRAREHEVVRANQQQQQSASASASSSSSRSQQQLQQLELREDENRYETQQTARPQENQEQREDRQVLNRLRELAQRQGDLNERIKELQSALEEAQTQQEREEIERQLRRLRDEQQQILRDTEELQQRMESPENQQRMNQERQQLEQARENARQASEALQQGQVSRAAAEGTRAERELRDLRDEFQEHTSGQFAEEMREMREQARQLDENEQKIAEQLTELNRPQQSNSLRDGNERENVAEQLERQQRDLQNLIDRMKETVEVAEVSEPLLAEKLYDTLRENFRQDPGKALESTRQSLNRGLPEDARNEERRAGEGISQLREGVDQAAEQVLGDETEALRRANEELQRLNEELRGELARATEEERDRGTEGQRDGETEGQQPGQGQPGQQNQPGQQPGDPQDGQRNPGQGGNPGQNQQPGERQPGENQQPGQQQPRDNQPGENQPGENQPGQDQPGQQNQPGQQGQPGQQPGQGQPGQNEPGQQNQPGQQPGQQGQPGQQPGQNQPGQNQPGQRGGDDRTASGPRGLDQLIGGGGNERVVAPIGGADYLDWSDRLRDVEEMIADPELRAEAARIRDRAKEIRKDVKRHSEVPNWDLVRMTVAEPLGELQRRVAEEILRRSSRDALVPIDRDPVPAQYEEQVRRYYERLGVGHD